MDDFDEGEAVQRLVRRTAKSGKVDYTPAVVLHETSRSRLTAAAFFVPHSDHTEFQLKIEGFTKAKDQPWRLNKEKTFNVGEPGSRQLLKFLQTHLPLAHQQHAGEFIVMRISNGETDYGNHDPKQVVAALATVLAQRDLVKHLAGTELSKELASALRGSIRLTEMRAAVAELRAKLDGGVCAEQPYQEWCESHCWAFGNAYVIRDDVRSISAGDNLDLMLPTVIAGYRDIVELKRPDKDVLIYDAAHRNHYFSAHVSQAIGQCHRYLDVLHECAENGLRDHREVVAYHPRATIVIGRWHDWDDASQKALHGLNRRLHGISVMTYDHLLAQGERLLDMLAPPTDVSSPKGLSAEDDDSPW